MINAILAVAAGGALGASMRYGTNQMILHWFNAPLFWATLLVNVLGCFLMGKAYLYVQTGAGLSEAWRLFVMVGFLGALTTWSTFSMETVEMLQNDQLAKAIGYTMATTFFCFTAFWLGVRT